MTNMSVVEESAEEGFKDEGSEEQNKEEEEAQAAAEAEKQKEKEQSIYSKDDKGGLVQVVKTCTKNFIGIPTKITSIIGKVEDIHCGDYNSFSIVEI